MSEIIVNTAWKVSKYRVSSGTYFPVFGPEKTPYLDSFHAVKYFPILHYNNYKLICSYPLFIVF